MIAFTKLNKKAKNKIFNNKKPSIRFNTNNKQAQSLSSGIERLKFLYLTKFNFCFLGIVHVLGQKIIRCGDIIKKAQI